MPIYRVAFEDALLAYCEGMKVPDARPYILNENAIRSAIGRPYHTVLGLDAFPTLHQKAAALLDAMARAHGFSDGNKRTAVMLTLFMIRASGYDLSPISREKLDDVVVELLEGKRTMTSVAFWVHLVIDLG